MKKILPVILSLLAMPALSQQMLIEKSGSESTIVGMGDFKRITFDEGSVNILTDNTTITTQMSEISRIMFGDFTEINEISVKGDNLISHISTDEIAVHCNAGETINIYNINGSHILQVRQQAYGGSISISSLPKGIYLIQAAGRTAKFMKR